MFIEGLKSYCNRHIQKHICYVIMDVESTNMFLNGKTIEFYERGRG